MYRVVVFLTMLVKLKWVMYPLAVLLIIAGIAFLVFDFVDWRGWLLIGLGILQLYLQVWYARESKRVNPDDTIGV